ncbi:hypothetical protein QUF88_11010 [Bacillus sp. DX1.1]|uniref:hypothetical protein n=1 Tax=unclassified Bacillus (in: firmicutes) TaxID=185979 RepID=UPI002570BFFD|nr:MULTISPECIES: hypothetical protein [unclassified Bacillus (in: firmicutes)]MDM5154349.1 hypothetical protein [Bacillus sp. DX1.1]WJE83259.1 hypothetical protein QRE67_08515 [Bacillus sp. DX3.1]
MKRKVLLLLAFICFALPLQTSAFTFQELPVASKSKQWYIEIDKSKSENLKALQPKNGEFDTYSLFVKNIGKDVSNVSVEVYRNDPQARKAYELFSVSDMSISKSRTSFTHMNFPLYAKANKFEVVIKWEEKQFTYNGHPENAGRKYKQTFVFNEQ